MKTIKGIKYPAVVNKRYINKMYFSNERYAKFTDQEKADWLAKKAEYRKDHEEKVAMTFMALKMFAQCKKAILLLLEERIDNIIDMNPVKRY